MKSLFLTLSFALVSAFTFGQAKATCGTNSVDLIGKKVFSDVKAGTEGTMYEWYAGIKDGEAYFTLVYTKEGSVYMVTQSHMALSEINWAFNNMFESRSKEESITGYMGNPAHQLSFGTSFKRTDKPGVKDQHYCSSGTKTSDKIDWMFCQFANKEASDAFKAEAKKAAGK